MNFVFRGTRGDIETGFPGYIPERRAVRVHAARFVNTKSLAFLVTVLLLFMILNSHQMSPNFLLWLVLGVFLMATSLQMYATCQQLQAQAQAHAVAAIGLLGHTDLRLQMPPSIARLRGLRLQLALLDREFDDLDYETLRALDSDNNPSATSMREEEVNSLPVHKYWIADSRSCNHISGSLVENGSSSATNETLRVPPATVVPPTRQGPHIIHTARKRKRVAIPNRAAASPQPQHTGESSRTVIGVPLQLPQEMSWEVAQTFRNLEDEIRDLQSRVDTQRLLLDELSEMFEHLHHQVTIAKETAIEARNTVERLLVIGLLMGGIALTVIEGLVLVIMFRG